MILLIYYLFVSESDRRGIELVGLDREAEVPIGNEAIQWTDIIFVMEKVHCRRLSQKFQTQLKNKRLVCLDIPDQYDYVKPKLVTLLKKRVLPLLGQNLETLAEKTHLSQTEPALNGSGLSC